MEIFLSLRVQRALGLSGCHFLILLTDKNMHNLCGTFLNAQSSLRGVPNPANFISLYLKDEGVPQPLKSGSCTFHTGRTLHYSRGNSTDGYRRAYITNYRPDTMIRWERKRNFSHGKEVTFNIAFLRELLLEITNLIQSIVNHWKNSWTPSVQSMMNIRCRENLRQ